MADYRLDSDKASAKLVEIRGPEAKRARTLGQRNYLWAYGLTICALLASISAGALGLFNHTDARAVGLVALIPAAVTLALRTTKLQAKANLYYDLAADLEAILSRATFSDPQIDNAGTLAWEMSQRQIRFQADWMRLVGVEDQLPAKPEKLPSPDQP